MEGEGSWWREELVQRPRGRRWHRMFQNLKEGQCGWSEEGLISLRAICIYWFELLVHVLCQFFY